MSTNIIFTNGYINYQTNEIISNEHVYITLDEAIYNINNYIIKIFYDLFDIFIETKSLFSFITIDNNNDNKCEKIIKISNGKILLIIKNKDSLDIYSKHINKGYIYNSENTKHLFKFFINRHCIFNPIKDVELSDADYNLTNNLNITPTIINTVNKVSKYNDELLSELKQAITKFKIE